MDDAYVWLLWHLLEKTEKEVKRVSATGADAFTVRNETQVRQRIFSFDSLGTKLRQHKMFCRSTLRTLSRSRTPS